MRLEDLIRQADACVAPPDAWPAIARRAALVPPLRLDGKLLQDVKARALVLMWRASRGGMSRAG